MRFIQRIIFGSAIVVAFIGCSQQGESKPHADEPTTPSEIESQQSGIFALENQIPFDEKYEVNLILPMSEADFIGIIEDLNLNYSFQGPDGVGIGEKDYGYNEPYKPLLVKNYDMSNISHSYLVIGGYDTNSRINEMYLALVDTAGQVVYIENYFSELM